MRRRPGAISTLFQLQPSQMIAYGQRRRFGGMRGYRNVRFPLPFNGLGCASCRRRNCSSCGGKRPTLGSNIVSITWYNGQVLTFDLDDPAQKRQYDAVRGFMSGKEPQPTTTIIYGSSALTPPQVSSGTLQYVLQQAGAPATAAQPSWLDQQIIPGVKNMWLAAGVGGFVLLSARKGRR